MSFVLSKLDSDASKLSAQTTSSLAVPFPEQDEVKLKVYEYSASHSNTH